MKSYLHTFILFVLATTFAATPSFSESIPRTVYKNRLRDLVSSTPSLEHTLKGPDGSKDLAFLIKHVARSYAKMSELKAAGSKKRLEEYREKTYAIMSMLVAIAHQVHSKGLKGDHDLLLTFQDLEKDHALLKGIHEDLEKLQGDRAYRLLALLGMQDLTRTTSMLKRSVKLHRGTPGKPLAFELEEGAAKLAEAWGKLVTLRDLTDPYHVHHSYHRATAAETVKNHNHGTRAHTNDLSAQETAYATLEKKYFDPLWA